MFTIVYQGDNKTLFTPVTGEAFTLSQEEMQSLFETLREMSTIDDSTPNEIIELENRISELERERDLLQEELRSDGGASDVRTMLKRKLQDIIDEEL